jgi:hypothetical protein
MLFPRFLESLETVLFLVTLQGMGSSACFNDRPQAHPTHSMMTFDLGHASTRPVSVANWQTTSKAKTNDKMTGSF